MMDLNQILKYALKNKVITQAQMGELSFDTRREETDSIYLNEEEIREMYDLQNLPSTNHEIVRDIFVAACYMGLRFSDYSTLNLAKIHNNRLEIIQKKTGKKITLPIHPLVNEIFKKYNYRLPQVPKNNEFNRLIKEVGALMPSMQVEFSKQITYEREKVVITKPKYEFLQGHCPRRSLVTNEFMKGTDVPTIMSISGHKSYKNFLRYIKASGEEFADKLEKIWQERYSEIS
jgi:integrase